MDSKRGNERILQNLRKGLSPRVGAQPQQLPGSQSFNGQLPLPVRRVKCKTLLERCNFHRGTVSPVATSLCKLLVELFLDAQTSIEYTGFTAGLEIFGLAGSFKALYCRL